MVVQDLFLSFPLHTLLSLNRTPSPDTFRLDKTYHRVWNLASGVTADTQENIGCTLPGVLEFDQESTYPSREVLTAQ